MGPDCFVALAVHRLVIWIGNSSRAVARLVVYDVLRTNMLDVHLSAVVLEVSEWEQLTLVSLESIGLKTTNRNLPLASQVTCSRYVSSLLMFLICSILNKRQIRQWLLAFKAECCDVPEFVGLSL